jgi:uncharacterized protein YjbI with pentapeptide repeats
MSDQDNGQVSTLQPPTTNDPDVWKTYWEAQGQPWRTEPEIDAARQKYLAERRTIVPNIEQGIYPFKGEKLSRADVEWLLVTHDNSQGPVDWSGDQQVRRMGLDFRGMDLRKQDLRNLPLTRIFGGLRWNEWGRATEAQRRMAGALLESTNLNGAHLEWTRFRGAYLNEANLRYAHLEESDLRWANLERADLTGAYLERSNIDGVKLSDEKGIGPQLTDIHWGDTNLAVVNWSQIKILGDEYEARQKIRDGTPKDPETRLHRYERAVRANRQLAVALQSQGLNEDASRFAYRAQKLQRIVLRLQRKIGSYLFSIFLDLLAGYGYRPGRSVIWYLVTIFGFALVYFAIGHLPFLPDAFVFSLTSFHGRGFFPGLGSENSLHNPLVIMAAFEAVVGLLIEISFIATFTQRFFGR